MNLAAALRAAAVVAVTGAVFDPGCAWPRPPIVEVAFAGDVPAPARAGVLARVAAAAPWSRVVDAAAPRDAAVVTHADARVIAGEPACVLDALQRRHADLAWQWMPPALAISHVSAPARVVAGVRTEIAVGVTGLPAGTGLVEVSVTEAASGREEARAQASYTAAAQTGTVHVAVPWLATSVGPTRLRVRAALEPGGTVRPSPPADVGVDVRPARVAVSVLEARPTWAGRFARLALADQEGIDVHTEVRATPGVTVRTAPARTDTGGDPQVILVSGVEALSASDVARLESGVRQQGQAVVLLLDETPGPGPWRRLWPDDVGTLRTTPTPVTGHVAGHVWKMREWLSASVSTAVTPLAFMESGTPAFMLGRALGAGRIVLVTSLDAWRWRGDADAAFASGWRALVRRLGADVPPAVDVTAWVSGRGRRRVVHLDVSLRPDLAGSGDTTVGARWDSGGPKIDLQQVAVGRWRGAVRASAAPDGTLVVQAGTGGRTLAEERAVIDLRRTALAATWDDVAGHQVRRGALSTGDEPLPAVMARLQQALAPITPERWYVTRTWWFAGAVLAALGAEWILRRLAGGR